MKASALPYCHGDELGENFFLEACIRACWAIPIPQCTTGGQMCDTVIYHSDSGALALSACFRQWSTDGNCRIGCLSKQLSYIELNVACLKHGLVEHHEEDRYKCDENPTFSM